MRRHFLTVAFSLLMLGGAEAFAQDANVKFEVSELQSSGDAANLTRALSKARGVKGVTTNQSSQSVSIDFDSSRTNARKLKDVLRKAGFTAIDYVPKTEACRSNVNAPLDEEARLEKANASAEVVARLAGKGLSVARYYIPSLENVDDLNRVVNALNHTSGVKETQAELSSRVVIVGFDASVTSMNALKSSLGSAGYVAEELSSTSFKRTENKNVNTVTLQVDGLTGDVASKVSQLIGSAKGVKSMELSVGRRQIVVDYNPAQTKVSDLQRILAEQGLSSKVVE